MFDSKKLKRSEIMKNAFKLKQCIKRTAAAICSAAVFMTLVSFGKSGTSYAAKASGDISDEIGLVGNLFCPIMSIFDIVVSPNRHFSLETEWVGCSRVKGQGLVNYLFCNINVLF